MTIDLVSVVSLLLVIRRPLRARPRPWCLARLCRRGLRTYRSKTGCGRGACHNTQWTYPDDRSTSLACRIAP